jgi:type II secretory pathway pseudopilin PulG
MDVENTMKFALPCFSLRSAYAKHTTEDGFTMNELLVMLGVAMIIVGLAIPGLLRVRTQAKNEASAIALLRTVASSQVAYSKSCGSGGYAVDFTALGKPAPRSDAGFISKELSRENSPRRNGYTFALRPGAGAAIGPLDCHGIPTQTAYLATAQPVTFGIAGTGGRSFAVTSEETVWQIRAAVAPDEPFVGSEVPLQ